MIRFSLVLMTAFFMSHAFADDDQEVTEIRPAGTVADNPEAIVHQHDLATHMGWGEQQAVFRAPRNFRSNELNEISPDTLDDSSETGVNN
jgi:hypothetical protein